MPAITSTVQAQNIWVMTLYYNNLNAQKSFSQRFCLGVSQDVPGATTNYAIAQPTGADFLKFLPTVLGSNTQLVYGRISATNAGSNGARIVFAPQGGVLRSGEASLAADETPGIGTSWRFETPSRLHANRMLLGCRSSDIVDGVFQVSLAANWLSGYTLPSANTGLTAAQQYEAALYTIMTESFRSRFDRKTGLFQVEPWTSVSFNRVVSGHPCGPLYGVRPSRRRVRRRSIVV